LFFIIQMAECASFVNQITELKGDFKKKKGRI
jgi:hypothetical protein